ncbi:PREDICTED: RNA polymerase II degradation factor 1-like [Brassica oleracea var. oleracea]|nr:PREDICTED: RNA polymerase II degradation factor 1-like [Brassica oleracea var. oleracea]
MSGVKIIGGGGGGKKSYNGVSDIPSGSRKMVQSLKEIVNCPEAEIYAVLKDCNMDPNEAVNRLLSQDPFHEVKSKKDKKKEVRDIQDSRPRGYSNNYNRGTRGGSDRYAGPRRTGASSFNSTESGSFQGKTTNKRESEKQAYGGSFSSTSGVSSHQQIPHSDSVAVDSKTSTVSSGGGISSSQPVSVQQPAWFGAAGQRSMADIVKMGRPHTKTTNSQKIVTAVNQEHETVKDQWPSIEKPMATSTSSVSAAPTEPVICNGPADFQSSGGDQQLKGHLEDAHLAENGPFGNLGRDHVQADTVVVPEDDESEVTSEFDDTPYEPQTQSHPVEHQKDEDNVSSVAANLQELSIENHDKYSSHEENRPAVLIPDHLLIYSEECSQLSFGSFGSRPLNNNLEEASDVAPQIERADARNNEFYGDEQLGSTSHGNMVHASTAENYDDSAESQQEVLLPENPETAHPQNQYSFAQSDQEYAYENAKQQTNTAFDASQTSMQNQIASLTDVMQGYSNAAPNTLLGQTAQSARELELQYSTFPGGQSMPSRSNDYSLNDQSISMPETLRDGGGIQTTQPSQQQNIPGANIATGPALPQGPQQLPMHPYSQHTVPLTHFANMISYPLMPQGYPYMPSAFQQAFSGNSSYHQSPAALLPQYKNNISPSSLPQSAPISSPYGFGNSSNVGAGNFSLNQQQQQQQQAAPTGATLSYEDVMSLQYKQNSHLLSLQQQQQQQQQQNENSPVWLHGPGSQTMSGVQSNAYYNLQAQQQAQQLRQAQQQAQQQYGSLGYPNYYQSQTGMSMEHQQRNPREGGSQGQPSKQTPQQHLWQNSY